MKKIPTIFERDWDGDRSRIVDVPNPKCDWVFAGEGVATRKLDGTCCMIRDGVPFKRRELRKGEPSPANFEPADYDEETGKTIGWIPVGDGPDDRWHREAFEATLPDGTYELLGPNIQGNPEALEHHYLMPHSGAKIYDDVPRDFGGIRAWLSGKDIEGLVFHHQDGRMGKVKLRDFGLKRSALKEQ